MTAEGFSNAKYPPTYRKAVMKTVFTNKGLFEHFAKTARPFVRSANGTLSTEGDELKSYSTVIARKLKLVDGWNFAWVSSERYSNTTSKHQGQAQTALIREGFTVIRTPVCPVNRVASLRKAWNAQREAEKEQGRKAQEREDRRREREAKRVLAMPPQAKVEREAGCGSCGGTIADDSHEIARAESEGMPPSPPVAEPKFCNFDKAHGDKPAVAFDGAYDLCAQCADDLGVKYEKPVAPQSWTHAEA